MPTDSRKKITNIGYNHLNLPETVTIDGQEINYTYDATGTKLKKKVGTNTTDYLGGFQYVNGELQFFPYAEGYVAHSNGVYDYVYQYKDHLGNIRLSYSDKDSNGSIAQNEIVEENNYYPFGLKHKGYNNVINGTEYKYETFQGQELNDELGLNWLSFKWRNYDPEIGRFMSVDPLAEEFAYNSTYAFAENRVIDGFELEGLEWENFMSKFKKTSDLKLKPIPSGEGVQNQSYTIVVQNPKKTLNDLRSTFRDSPQDILSNSKAIFQPVDKNGKLYRL